MNTFLCVKLLKFWIYWQMLVLAILNISFGYVLSFLKHAFIYINTYYLNFSLSHVLTLAVQIYTVYGKLPSPFCRYHVSS